MARTESTSPDADLAALTELLGLDLTASTFRRWRSASLERDKAVLRSIMARIHDEAIELFPAGTSAAGIDDRGLDFLACRTHFLRYACDRARWVDFAPDIRLNLAMAAALAGGRARIAGRDLRGGSLLLLEGSNIVVTPDDSGAWPDLHLDGDAGTLTIGERAVPVRFGPDRVIAEAFDSEQAAALPYEGDFITLFEERAPEGKGEPTRRLVLQASEVAPQLDALSRAKTLLQAKWPGAWECVRGNILYVNWTDIASSGMDTREHRCSIRLHARAELDPEEQDAWVLSSLYHESKHIQFFETFHPWSAPGTSRDENPFPMLGPAAPRVPCAWRGLPASRTLPDHLLALQAFVPGLVAGFSMMRRLPQLSQWSRDHIEMDMRGINGAIGVLILGQKALTPVGQLLSDIIRRDYALHLVPAFEQLIAQPKLVDVSRRS